MNIPNYDNKTKSTKEKFYQLEDCMPDQCFLDACMWRIRNGENEYIDSYVIKTIDILRQNIFICKESGTRQIQFFDRKVK